MTETHNTLDDTLLLVAVLLIIYQQTSPIGLLNHSVDDCPTQNPRCAKNQAARARANKKAKDQGDGTQKLSGQYVVQDDNIAQLDLEELVLQMLVLILKKSYC